MEKYEALAAELFASLSQKHRRPPHEDVSTALRGETAVLRLLNEEERSLTAGDISRLLHMTTSRIAAVLNTLQKKRLILRSRGDADKRCVLVTLTPEGRALCEKRKRRALKNVADVLAGLGEEDAAHFVRIMKRIQQILPDNPPELCDQDEAYDKEAEHEQ